MKNNILWLWSLGLALALPLASGCVQQASSATENVTPAIETAADSGIAPQGDAEENDLALEQSPEEDISNAPAKPISTEKPLPPNLKATGAVSEIIKLADAGVDESVMLAFVNKSTSTFNLRSDEIIYLKDIGVANSVVTAMIQHDETLKESLTAAAAAVAAPDLGRANPLDTPTYGAGIAPPVEAAPQTGYASEPYGSLTPPAEAVTDSSFYDSLSPYGSWVDVGGYGRCWQPTVTVINSGWRPYFDCGRWVYTDCGWYWNSDYSWGWAPFHYGRWFRHQNLGWCWTPDTVWGPSWVSWRYNHDYCGWAPLPPRAHFRPGVGLVAHGRGDFGLGIDSFAFIPFSHFRDHYLTHHALLHDQVSRIFNQTVVSTRIHSDHNRVINNGITPEHVAAVTRTEVPRITIHETTVAGGRGTRTDRLDRNGGTISVFRLPLTHSVGTLANAGQVSAERNTSSFGSLAGRGLHAVPQPNRPEAVRSTGSDNLDGAHSARGTPLIIRGPDRSAQTEERNSATLPAPTAPHNSVILIGRKDATTGRSLPPQHLNQPDSGRWTPNSQQLSALAPQAPSPSYSPWPAQRPSNPLDRLDHQPLVQHQQAPNFPANFEQRLTSRAIAPQTESLLPRHSAPVYEGSAPSAHVDAPRYAPSPSFAPQPTHTAPVMESHAYSAPPAPPAQPSSSSSSHSHSGSDRNSR